VEQPEQTLHNPLQEEGLLLEVVCWLFWLRHQQNPRASAIISTSKAFFLQLFGKFQTAVAGRFHA
jgi:hypothetical protein